jgi:hypothetical protein
MGDSTKNDKSAAQGPLPLDAGSAGHDGSEANTACRNRPHSRFGAIICPSIGGDGCLSFRIRGSKGVDELVDFVPYIVPHGFRKVRFADVPDDV